MTIASSTARRYILAAMERLGCADYFQAVLSCVEYETSKSEPMIFFEAMKVMGTSPDRNLAL